MPPIVTWCVVCPSTLVPFSLKLVPSWCPCRIFQVGVYFGLDTVLAWLDLDVYGVLWLIRQFYGIVPLQQFTLHVKWMCCCAGISKWSTDGASQLWCVCCVLWSDRWLPDVSLGTSRWHTRLTWAILVFSPSVISTVCGDFTDFIRHLPSQWGSSLPAVGIDRHTLSPAVKWRSLEVLSECVFYMLAASALCVSTRSCSLANLDCSTAGNSLTSWPIGEVQMPLDGSLPYISMKGVTPVEECTAVLYAKRAN